MEVTYIFYNGMEVKAKFKSRVYVKKSWKPIDDHGHRVVIIPDYPSDIGAK